MSEPIKAGDLVICYRPWPCCENDAGMGRVSKVYGFVREGNCARCGASFDSYAQLDGGATPPIRLKRLPNNELMSMSNDLQYATENA